VNRAKVVDCGLSWVVGSIGWTKEKG